MINLRGRLLLAALMLLSLALMDPLRSAGTTLNVPAEYPTIQAALAVATDGDEIVVAPGTYEGPFNLGSRTITIRSTNPLDPGTVSATVLNGMGMGHTISAAFSGGAVIQGVTITGGAGGSAGGGGVYATNSSIAILNCLMYGNTGLNGSAVLTDGGATMLLKTRIMDHTGAQWGTVRCVNSSAVTIEGCWFHNNTTTGTGGAVEVFNCTASITNSIFTANTSVSGGAISAQGTGSCSLINDTFFHNVAPSGGSTASFLTSSASIVRNCIISDGDSGALGWYSGAMPTVTYCNFYNNTGGNTVGFSITPGLQGNMQTDPLFASTSLSSPDVHLQSKVGRFSGGSWVTDAAQSPCIDAGDPNDAYAAEPSFNGNWINMGAYGNTAEASKSESRVQIAETGKWYQTIQNAISRAGTGQTIKANAGTYYERLNLLGKNITVRSASDPSQHDVIVDAQDLGSVVTCNSGEPSSAVITGFWLVNGNAAMGAGILCDLSSSPTITNNIISSNTGNIGAGLYVGAGCAPQISSNGFGANQANNGAAIYCATGSSASIENNRITGNTASAFAGGIYAAAYTITIRNNVLYGNHASTGGGLACASGTQQIINNTFYDNTASSGGGIYTNNSSANIRNCIVVSSSWSGITVSGSPQPTIAYCDFLNAAGNYSGIADQTGTNGNISVNPMLADPANNDFHLKSATGRWTGSAWVTDAVTSPCIDAGDPSSAYNNEPAYNGSRVNMGAYGNTAEASKSPPAQAKIVERGLEYGAIQTAIAAANAGETVEVYAGTHYETLDFLGKAITVRSTDPLDPAVVAATILDGSNTRRLVNFSNSEGAGSELSGLTLQNGNPGVVGGAIFCSGAGPKITRNVIRNCTGTQGGALYLGDSNAVISGNLIYSCNAPGGGGGICCAGTGSAVIDGNTIYNVVGTGIYATSTATPSVKNCIISICPSAWCLYGPSGTTASHCLFYNPSYGLYGGTMGVPVNSQYNVDPKFADAPNGDFHLKSTAGRWTGSAWTTDTENSPALDAAEAAATYSNEPTPNGLHRNLGAEGDSPYASKSPQVVKILETGQCWSTIQGGIYGASGGQTVEVLPGTYKERISFMGKAITLRSTDPWNPAVVGSTIINGTGLGGTVVAFTNSETYQAVLSGFTITGSAGAGSGGGIFIDNASPSIYRNIIENNSVSLAGGGIYAVNSASAISGNLIRNNRTTNVSATYGAGVCLSQYAGKFSENTVVANGPSQYGGGVWMTNTGGATITNTIIAFNKGGYGLYVGMAGIGVPYSCFYGNEGGEFYGCGPGTGSLVANPLFGDGADGSTDAHLKSVDGRWDPSTSEFVSDRYTSPCIDAADPASPFSNELSPNGERANMGYYGNTKEASKSGTGGAPGAPSNVAISPSAPKTADDLVVTYDESTDPDGDPVSYRISWSSRPVGSSTWGDWKEGGDTLPAGRTMKNQEWRARVRATDGVNNSAWTIANFVTIGDTPPLPPKSVTIDNVPVRSDAAELLASDSGDATDPDPDDTVEVQYRWFYNNPGGPWLAWNGGTWAAPWVHPMNGDFSKGQVWYVEVQAVADGVPSVTTTASEHTRVLNTPPTAPTVQLSPGGDFQVVSTPRVSFTAASTDYDNDDVRYEYDWQSSGDGTTFTSSGCSSQLLDRNYVQKGQYWRVCVRALDSPLDSPARVARKGAPKSKAEPEEVHWSDWAVTPAVQCLDTPPGAPSFVRILPEFPRTGDTLTVEVGTVSDPDGADTPEVQWRWYKSMDGGASWTLWSSGWSDAADNPTGSEIAKGELWKAEARGYSAGVGGPETVESAPVRIMNTPPPAPLAVTITPDPPTATDDLAAAVTPPATADADGDTIRYEYQWASRTASTAWGAWTDGGAVLPAANLAKNAIWKVRVRSVDTPVSPAAVAGKRGRRAKPVPTMSDETFSAWVESGSVTVGDSGPKPPTNVRVTPEHPRTTDNLSADAVGGLDPDGETVTYVYLWHRSRDGGESWTAWGTWGSTHPDASQTVKGELWKAQAKTVAGGLESAIAESGTVLIGNSAPPPPASVTIAPANPKTDQDLTVAVTDGGSDPDSDMIRYEFQWACSVTPGTWGPWQPGGSLLPASKTTKGEQWKVQARATDLPAATPAPSHGARKAAVADESCSAWVDCASTVQIVDTAPTPPAQVKITPVQLRVGVTPTAIATGGMDPDAADTLTYQYQWASSTDGATWSGWGAAPTLVKGLYVKAQARSASAGAYSAWVESPVAVVGNTPPTPPTTIAINPAAARRGDDLLAVATGGGDADAADTISYEYQWAQKAAGASVWSKWRPGTATTPGRMVQKGDQWKVRVRTSDEPPDLGPTTSSKRETVFGVSAWLESAVTVVGDTAPTAPVAVVILPRNPHRGDQLVAQASGALDVDGDALEVHYVWSRNADGATWTETGETAPQPTDLVKGERWKAAAYVVADGVSSPRTESSAVTVLDTAPGVPTSVSLLPLRPRRGTDLRVRAEGAVDVDSDTITYAYQWTRSEDGGETWLQWLYSGRILGGHLLHKGEVWKARVRATSGEPTAFGAWVETPGVVVGDAPPLPPTKVTITPRTPRPVDFLHAGADGGSDPDGDRIRYQFQWCRSRDGGVSWEAWGHDGPTLGEENTEPGELWKTRARSVSGLPKLRSQWVESVPVTIGTTLVASAPLTIAANAAPVANGSTQIAVSLSAPALVQVQVMNLAGRTVAVLPERSLAAGLQTLLWNGRSSSGTLAPRGQYLIWVIARNEEGACLRAMVPLMW